MSRKTEELLIKIYGDENGRLSETKLRGLLEKWKEKLIRPPNAPSGTLPLDEKDAVIITYGDSIRQQDEPPLKTLGRFFSDRLRDTVSGIHILPFSPYSSDDGFSVINYREINPDLGDWEMISGIAGEFRCMADLVLNHCSVRNPWFLGFQNNDPRYAGYFISVDPETDLSAVFRPRALPLLHEYETKNGRKHVWTTFSEDQADLNFANPDVFLEFTDILLNYISRGIQIIRLDAIGFLWKEVGTSCMHHPKTHAVVQLFRQILSETAPWTVLITETNVPHRENISYFGDGGNEAQMVYQFSLPPLTLDAVIREDTAHLTKWAGSLPAPSPDHTFFNFLASHDGIGVLPARGYLSAGELDRLIETVMERGGCVSYKSTPEGDIPYELNISYCDAAAEQTLPPVERARKFLTTQAVMLSMAGIPGIYIHSLLGSGNWYEGIKQTGMNRSINREKCSLRKLTGELDDRESFRSLVFGGFAGMLRTRRQEKAFHPSSAQKVLEISPKIFALVRGTGRDAVLCLHNFSSLSAGLDSADLPEGFRDPEQVANLLNPDTAWNRKMDPFETQWLKRN
jgi:sucrose phosphorylase